VVKGIDFTVITLVYNGYKYVKRTLSSGLNFVNELKFEYSFVNNGSTHSIGAIFPEFKDRIRIVNHNNSSESSGVHLGIQKGNGACLVARREVFNFEVEGRKLLMRSFLTRKSLNDADNLRKVHYPLFLPWSRILNPLIRLVIK
jgi:glycosyltransferase involved in cell wall biosynthesis